MTNKQMEVQIKVHLSSLVTEYYHQAYKQLGDNWWRARPANLPPIMKQENQE